MVLKVKSCCVTGHRSISPEMEDFVKKELRKEIILAINDGYTHFISGFAIGTDLIFADIVVEQKTEHPYITLEAAIPYGRRLETSDIEFNRLIEQCDAVVVKSEQYTKNCFFIRNLYMVENSERVIAVYDGRKNGGTAFTIRKARISQREVRIILI